MPGRPPTRSLPSSVQVRRGSARAACGPRRGARACPARTPTPCSPSKKPSRLPEAGARARSISHRRARGSTAGTAGVRAPRAPRPRRGRGSTRRAAELPDVAGEEPVVALGVALAVIARASRSRRPGQSSGSTPSTSGSSPVACRHRRDGRRRRGDGRGGGRRVADDHRDRLVEQCPVDREVRGRPRRPGAPPSPGPAAASRSAAGTGASRRQARAYRSTSAPSRSRGRRTPGCAAPGGRASPIGAATSKSIRVTAPVVGRP